MGDLIEQRFLGPLPIGGGPRVWAVNRNLMMPDKRSAAFRCLFSEKEALVIKGRGSCVAFLVSNH